MSVGSTKILFLAVFAFIARQCIFYAMLDTLRSLNGFVTIVATIWLDQLVSSFMLGNMRPSDLRGLACFPVPTILWPHAVLALYGADPDPNDLSSRSDTPSPGPGSPSDSAGSARRSSRTSLALESGLSSRRRICTRPPPPVRLADHPLIQNHPPRASLKPYRYKPSSEKRAPTQSSLDVFSTPHRAHRPAVILISLKSYSAHPRTALSATVPPTPLLVRFEPLADRRSQDFIGKPPTPVNLLSLRPSLGPTLAALYPLGYVSNAPFTHVNTLSAPVQPHFVSNSHPGPPPAVARTPIPMEVDDTGPCPYRTDYAPAAALVQHVERPTEPLDMLATVALLQHSSSSELSSEVFMTDFYDKLAQRDAARPVFGADVWGALPMQLD
ncbi:hypothetical protein FB451DRAFT_1369707 [Mycena latifolia]|nr:hypothetical protein FB451DRAFT_1369707 [Mycena latifolia]